MKKMVLGLMVVAGLLGTSTVVANAADTGGVSTGDVSFSSGGLSMSVNGAPLSFGTHTISADGMLLQALEPSPMVTVSDFRGNPTGWSLTVTQDQQFHTKTDGSSSELTDAALTVVGTKDSSYPSDSTVNTVTLKPGKTTSGTTTNGDANTVASASTGQGNGISQFNFSKSTLNIPRTTPKLAQEYTTKLTWNLGDVQSNN